MRKKKETTGNDCVAVRRLFEACHLNPQYLINYLEKRSKLDEMMIESLRKESLKYPDLQQDVIKMEIENTTAQLMIGILKIGLTDGKISKHVNPSMN